MHLPPRWHQERINDVRAEGQGRSVQRPRKRLKFENVLTVVPLLFLACTRRLHKGRERVPGPLL